MEKLRIKYGIKVDRMPNGYSLGVFFTINPINQITECYLLLNLIFWSIAIGRFWE